MERPPSPCIKVCALDPQGYCAGCLRTAAEIGAWISMGPVQQWQLIAELAQRRQGTESQAFGKPKRPVKYSE
jgi:uncharacterized protein